MLDILLYIKPDKGNRVVILEKQEYVKGMLDILLLLNLIRGTG